MSRRSNNKINRQHGNYAKRFTELSKKHPESYGKEIGSWAATVVKTARNNAKKRKLEWKLTDIEAFEFMISKCGYCGDEPSIPENKNGIDRIDNNVGYIFDNCVACCKYCNYAKFTNNINDFKIWINNIYVNFISSEKCENVNESIQIIIETIKLKCINDEINFQLRPKTKRGEGRNKLGYKYPSDYGKFNDNRSLAVKHLSGIKKLAKVRGKLWNLHDIYGFELCLSDCFYCGKKSNWPDKRNGIDRVNNNIGYIESNTVPACIECNIAKSNSSVDEFKNWIIRLYNNLILGNK